MVSQVHSQNTLTEENRVKSFINAKGDTMVIMAYEDARVLLKDVLHYEYADSLLSEYKVRDSLNTSTIEMQKDVLMKLGEEKLNLEQMNTNLNEIITNKDKEISLKDDIIKEQKKEIRKQKILKVIGFTAAVVLPILTLILIL